MPDFTVQQRGTDTSGRGIYATAYMWDWWDRVCHELGFTPTIVQGAFMGRAGGGAAASAGYHDGAGCFDLRTWDRTQSEVAATIRTLRDMGAAAWVRDSRHGMDPHIHFVLGADQPLASGAAYQWRQYLDGRDGLASNGPDYHPRPNPLVTTPPEDPMADYAEQLDRIERKIDASREREVQIRKRVIGIDKGLERLAAEVKDDATKEQVRRLRADIADVLTEDTAADA